jgi:predicted nucleic acid-binding protein
MAGDVFVDTNVLVYSRDTAELDKHRKAAGWMTHLWNTRQGRLSYQVLQEFYVTVTEKLDPGLDRAAARRVVRSLLPWRPVPIDTRVLEGASRTATGSRGGTR